MTHTSAPTPPSTGTAITRQHGRLVVPDHPIIPFIEGDGKMAASITGAKPSDLSDASWKHGSSDGEIFVLIRDGSKGTGMRGYATKLKTDDIWNVVNYLRTLGPKPAKSH